MAHECLLKHRHVFLDEAKKPSSGRTPNLWSNHRQASKMHLGSTNSQDSVKRCKNLAPVWVTFRITQCQNNS